MAETTKVNYKKTLNLPATSFPMRAALAANEPKSLARWQRDELYEAVTADRRDAEQFVFHDGPPYANGLIHVGHLLNKVLKDFVVRSRLMAGRFCRFVPGWDCHGLPIEHKVMTELKATGELEALHALGEDERREAIRLKCAAYAEKYQGLQADQMKRLLTLADYEHPYLTMVPGYERAVMEVFADLVEQGLVYRALKSVHWSVENQTALAEAELEYHDREDTSVYVDFEAADRDAVARAFGVELDETPSFMIWTTTPWTLPANLAVAVHERFRYALVRVDGNVTVIASELVETVTEAAGSTSVEVLAEAHGADLVGLTYRHPLDHPTYGVCPIVKADYVTLEDGTGLVHTAPGHGEEDNLTAVREGLDVYCPVRADGTYDDTVPPWLVGMSIWEANDRVVDRLRAAGNLYHAHRFVHSYPHDWRSKTPVIFRATEQWFIGVDRPTAHGQRSLRELALAECESDVAFIPEWGRARMRGMIETRPEWCISRQRAWGLPIPAFRTPDGEVLLTTASVRAIAAVFGQRGSDAWFTETPPQLLAGYDLDGDPEAPAPVKAAGVSGLRKMYDIFDVWFESGTSWHAVMRRLDLGFPVDLYLEGSDQHRGWFQLSMLPALGATGTSPFRAVLTHGFTVDKDGRKMSKSLGNTIDVEDLLGDYGADVCRWWVSSLAFENDVKVDMSFFDLAGETYRKVRNTLRFLLSNLTGAGPAPDLGDVEPTSIHACVLGQAASMQQQVLEAYENYAFRKAHQLLYDFCNDTLSAFYCAAVKDRLYCDKPDSPRRLATQRVMRTLLEMLCQLLAPILPHTADEAYRALWSAADGDGRSVHLETFADLPEVKVDFDWPKLMQLREAVLKALEDAKQRGVDNPLDAEVALADAGGWLEKFEPDLADLFGVSRVRRSGDAVVINDLRGEPRCDRCWKRLESCAGRTDGGTLCARCAEAVGV
ncbi:MAG: isoleucine--tRNA ligase [Planctomycetota bacterium]|jgi:isoleucyl-tRNA synthetase